MQPAGGADATVTFLVKSVDGQVPRIVSDVTGWGENVVDNTFDLTRGTMTRVGSTDWFRLDTKVAPGARIEYLIVHGQTEYRTDPHNPRLSLFGDRDPVSELVTPGYAPPAEFTDPPAASAGRTIDATIKSRALGGSRRVIVYEPPGCRGDGAYPVAVFHSGLAVAQQGEAPRVLDWLVARGEIEPIVAVFLESFRDSAGESYTGEGMRAFLAQEVPAWLASRRGVTGRAGERALIAISYGAKDAVDAAFAQAETYGRLGLLIPGRRLRHSDLEAAARRQDRRLGVAILAGRYDAANLATARDARDVLIAAGHAVEYIEVPEGHNPSTWRNHLRDVLVSLFGTKRLDEPQSRAASKSRSPAQR